MKKGTFWTYTHIWKKEIQLKVRNIEIWKYYFHLDLFEMQYCQYLPPQPHFWFLSKVLSLLMSLILCCLSLLSLLLSCIYFPSFGLPFESHNFFLRTGTVFHYVLYRLERNRSPKDLIPKKNAAKFFAGGPALISVFSLGLHSLLQFQLLELSEGFPGVSWPQENGDERRGKAESKLESCTKGIGGDKMAVLPPRTKSQNHGIIEWFELEGNLKAG